MPAFGQAIRNVISGEPLKIERDVYGIPENITLTRAGLRILAASADLDSSSIILIDITTVLLAIGQILDDDTDNNGVGIISFVISDSATNATITMDPIGADNDVKFSAVTAGQLANNHTIEYIDPAAANQTLAITVTDNIDANSKVIGKKISISLATDGGSVITTTGGDITTAVLADAVAVLLVTPTNIGTGTGLVTALAATNLTGGNGGTTDLTAGTTYYYRITTFTTQDESDQLLESGTIITRSETDTTPIVAITTTARAAQTASPRVNNLIDAYLDAMLHDFRQLRVWDEHARRVSNDSTLLRLTYRNINPRFFPEVWNGQNQPLEANDFEIEYDAGTVRITSPTSKNADDGFEDYFVTYEFDMFPARDLEIFLDLTLQELNIAGAANGGFITDYANIDDAPLNWDGPLVSGALVKAFRRLASDSGLWKNYLIWSDGAQTAGPQIATESAAFFNDQYTNLQASIKQLHLLARPTEAFNLFQQVGFGFFAVAGSKFRELRVNRLSTH